MNIVKNRRGGGVAKNRAFFKLFFSFLTSILVKTRQLKKTILRDESFSLGLQEFSTVLLSSAYWPTGRVINE
jgi:hypothetical protein